MQEKTFSTVSKPLNNFLGLIYPMGKTVPKLKNNFSKLVSNAYAMSYRLQMESKLLIPWKALTKYQNRDKNEFKSSPSVHRVLETLQDYKMLDQKMNLAPTIFLKVMLQQRKKVAKFIPLEHPTVAVQVSQIQKHLFQSILK